jgi:Contractile injection system tape measure protein
MPASTLVIQKLIVDVYIDEHPQPVVLLNDTSRALTQLVLPLIEQELERIRLPEQSVKIHTMEVEVKSDSLHTWKRDFSTTITKSITEACDQIVSVAGHQPARAASPNQDFSLTGEAIAVSEQEQLLALLCFFLLNGYLPWWKSGLGINSVRDLELRWMQSGDKEYLFLRLKQFLIDHPTALVRLVNQTHASFLQALLEYAVLADWNTFVESIPTIADKNIRFKCGLAVAAFNTMSPTVASFLSVVKELVTDHGLMAELTRHPQLAAIPLQQLMVQLDARHFHQKRTFTTTADWLAYVEKEGDATLVAFIREACRNQELMQVIKPSLNACIAASGTIPVTLRDWLSTIPGISVHTGEINRLLTALETAPERALAEKSSELLAELSRSTDFSMTAKSETAAPTVEEPIYTSNAGVVLLHPFLPTLFRNFELLDENNDWVSVAHQLEAIYWIHYLATGQTDPSEDELTVAKLLTGFPLTEVIPVYAMEPDSAFLKRLQDPKTAQELTDLLQVVRDNWRPMRNCTWEGLRTDFLTRSARIHQTNSMQYVLTVEPHTFDLMLPFKEWGVSMIKFSWMEEVLYVEWG